jgi:glyoxylase-like metal-dependent hydrolase (beta-lactamase superfamily II)
MRKFTNQIFSLFFFLFPATTVIAQNFDTINISTTKVRGAVYMLEGYGGNIGVLSGNDGLVLVDDQFEPLAGKIKTALSAINNKPVKFIINTHFHFDHSDGNKILGREGAVIVAHENVRKRLSTDQFIAAFTIEQKAYAYDALPKITFSESVTFNMNGETVQVFHVKNAHTDGDAIIYFKESDVMHTGDVFVRYGLPFIDMTGGGNVDGMLAAIDQLLVLINDNTIIIPGHGPLSNKKDLQNYKDMVETVRGRVAEGIKNGKTLDQIIDANPVKEYKTIFDKTEFVRIVYNSIKR